MKSPFSPALRARSVADIVRKGERTALLGAIVLLCCACTHAYQWKSLGPFETSGAIRHILVDPVTPRRLYAASENGGVWVLDDVDKIAQGWRPLSDQLENLQMRGIAKSPTDPEYIVTANILGFVYHTRDHGANWSRIHSQSYSFIRRLLIAEGTTSITAGLLTRPVRETMVHVAGRTGLHRIRLVNGVFDRVDTLFPRLSVHGSDVLDVARDPTEPRILLIGVRGQGVWHSADDGQTWSLTARWADFGDSGTPMIKLAMSARRTVAKFGRNVIVNDRRGVGQWRQLDSVGFGADIGGNDLGYRGGYTARGEWVHAVAIHPSDTAVVFAGQGALFGTANGGATWAGIVSGHEDIQSLAFSPDGKRLFIATDGGVRMHNLETLADTNLNIGLTTMQFYRAGRNGTAVVGSADHQGIRGTRNVDATSVTWERATTSASGFGNNALENDFVFADRFTPGRFFVAFQSQFLLRLRYPATGVTADLLPFESPTSPLQPFTAHDTRNPAVDNRLNYPVGTLAFDPRKESNTILVAAHEALNQTFSIRRTRDGNANPSGGPANNCGDSNSRTFCFPTPVVGTATWVLSHGPIATPIVSIAFSATEARRVYALTERGSVLVKADIDDDATAWRPAGGFAVGPTDFARQLVSDHATAGRLYAISHQQFMVSTDSGATWARSGQATLPTSQLNAFAQHPANARTLYLATENDVLVSDNAGVDWRTIGVTLPNAPVMQLFTDGSWLYAVTFGRGLWRTALPGPCPRNDQRMSCSAVI